MKKTARKAMIMLLVTVMATLSRQIPSSKAELNGEMPVVFVESQNSFAAVGTIFNVSVKIFNLTNNYYKTDVRWSSGEALPPPGSRYNYSLGNMYGFDISFSWDPAVLEYVGRVVMTPVEEYPDGVLHGAVWQVKENIDSIVGTYSVAYRSAFAIQPFNCPEKNATVFTITFRVKTSGECLFDLERVELTVDPYLVYNGVEEIIPIQVLDGDFTSTEMTRITSIDIGVLINGQLLTPVILGENATLRIFVANDGATMDSYNLTLYKGAIPLESWDNENLTSQEEATYNYTLETEGLGIGRHFLTATATILHDRTMVIDSFTANFTVIATPLLNITVSPKDVYANTTAILSAENSFHRDLNGQIVDYKWVLYKPDSIFPFYYEGIRINHTFVENGTWRIMLIVEDNWGITSEMSRNSTEPYSITMLLEVHAGSPPPPPPPPDSSITFEQIAIVVACSIIIIIVGVAVYRFREKRRRMLL